MNIESNTPIIEKLNNHFKLPIYYNNEKMELNKNIITDLELISTVDESNNSIYSYCFNNENSISLHITKQISQYYTTDIPFLKDNQKLLKDYQRDETKYANYSTDYQNIINIWKELKMENGFKEKYYYVDWDLFECLNTSEFFLQFISIYNLFSPIFSLMIPIIILIIPFFILRMKGLPLTISEYIDVLKIVAHTNAIGKLFTVNFESISFQEQIYIFISAALYLFSIYQNVMICIRFNNNMKLIHDNFKEIHIYIEKTLNRMNNYLLYSENLSTHKPFNENLKIKIQLLESINLKIKSISPYCLYNISKIQEIGKILKYFYELHSKMEYEDVMLYSLGFNGYIDCIEGLKNNIKERKINFAEIINGNKKSFLKKSYYACLKDNHPVKNTIKFNKNLIITGPNASGKTTILKSTLINILLTQQFGCGFYESAKFNPFKFIHCYLNIPDTSGRDSLFQAEARRCKEIIDIIELNKKETHFCVFDELYSGTNPDEAEISAVAFMKYLQKYKNVMSMLTTHFIKVCKKLDKIETIQNCKMVSKKINKKIKYTFLLKNGISQIKGGINILTEMNYPKEIIDSTL